MFHFPGCPLLRLWIHLRVTALSSGRVSPFGDPWIYACLRLPKAFRSLLRPSSAIGAMASALCSFLLDLSPFDSFLSRTVLRPETFVEPVPVFRTGYSQISLSIRLSLCSFQGALKARFPDPSKRYRNHHRTTVKSLAEQLALFYSAGLAPACRSFRLLLRLRSSLQRSRVSVPTSSFDLGL